MKTIQGAALNRRFVRCWRENFIRTSSQAESLGSLFETKRIIFPDTLSSFSDITRFMIKLLSVIILSCEKSEKHTINYFSQTIRGWKDV